MRRTLVLLLVAEHPCHETPIIRDVAIPGVTLRRLLAILGRMNRPTSPADSAKPTPVDEDHPELTARHSRVALVLFFIYLAAYGGFMGLSAFAPRIMAQPALLGVNVAIMYGLALIVGAVVLALVYMVACKVVSNRFHAGK